ARYNYEHWYLANIYYDQISTSEFFTLLRSRTPPGEANDVIATRRP
ncbi:fatty acid cis/trans isomerase, partial [Pseudoalteromonas ruthenica]